MRNLTKKITYAITSFLIAAVAMSLFTSQVEAASGFQPGNIMSDAVFTNHRSMTAPQINDFLHSKVPHCDRNGDQPHGDTTRRQYAASRGVSTPFTCLKDYRENGKSAARIIYDAAQEFRINPQVIIVLIQKEQGLITDDWPWPVQYRTATGYGCPDTAPCDSQYYGLNNQVRWAGRMFRAIMNDSSTWYTPYNLGNNQIPWHPDAGRCGHSTVNIQNRTTKALYNYTPYRPNQAALNAGYGTGDSCSSYGNRNFYLYFKDWFGDPHRASSYTGYQATWSGQSGYPTIQPGESRTISITYRNTGSNTWYDDTSAGPNNTRPVRLATDKPMNRSSAFGATWGSDNNRPTGNFAQVFRTNGSAYATNPHIVKPGESARFDFTITVPENFSAGTYRQHFKPIVEGGAAMDAPEVFIDVRVAKKFQATWRAQSNFPTISPGGTATTWIDYTNTGNTAWFDNRTAAANKSQPVRLATSSDNEPGNTSRTSPFGQHWGYGKARPAGNFAQVFRANGLAYTNNPHVVRPGETARFQFTFTVPDGHAPTQVQEWFQPVLDGASNWNMGGKAWLRVTVREAHSAKTMAATENATINPYTTREVRYRFKNTGNLAWSRSSTKLQVKSGNAAPLRGDNWESNAILATLNEASVQPGEVGSFTVRYNAPAREGTHRFRVGPAVNGTLVAHNTTHSTITVPVQRYTAAFHSHSSYPTIARGATATSHIMIKNTGNVPWFDSTAHRAVNAKPVVLATSNPINRHGGFGATWGSDNNRPATRFAAVYRADGSTLADSQNIAQPGEIVKFDFTFTIPGNQPSGTYRQWFQPLVEGSRHWDIGGRAFLNVRVP